MGRSTEDPMTNWIISLVVSVTLGGAPHGTMETTTNTKFASEAECLAVATDEDFVEYTESFVIDAVSEAGVPNGATLDITIHCIEDGE